jgi:hypothetical protein
MGLKMLKTVQLFMANLHIPCSTRVSQGNFEMTVIEISDSMALNTESMSPWTLLGATFAQ